jgi:hypothetical protein
VQWTVDDLDSGGELMVMANKNKSLASESDGDVFVGNFHTFVGHSWGGGAGKIPFVRKLNYLREFSRKSSGI